MAEDKKTILNEEGKMAKVLPNSSVPPPPPPPRQVPPPPRPMPAQPPQANKEGVDVQQTTTTKTKTQKVKKEKPKKEKKQNADKVETEKDKAKKKLWKKIRLYSIIGLSCAVVIGISILIILLSLKAEADKPLVMQGNAVVEVVAFNNQYYLEVPESEQAYYYVFELTSNETPVLIFNRTNKLNVSEYFKQKTTFTIKYYIQKISSASRSEASQSIEYTPKEQLLTPVLRLNEETNQFEWNYVLNADLYVFYYANEEDVLTYEYTPPANDGDNVGSFMPELGYGVYNISISAKSSNSTFYVESEQSNIITISSYKTQNAVLSASYSLSNQTIFIDASNIMESQHNFALHIGNQTLYFTPATKQSNYSINVSAHGLTITLGMTVTVTTLGDGQFLLDSQPKTCTPQN